MTRSSLALSASCLLATALACQNDIRLPGDAILGGSADAGATGDGGVSNPVPDGGAVDGGGCGPNACGACPPGAVPVDRCVDGAWACHCTVPDGGPRLCTFAEDCGESRGPTIPLCESGGRSDWSCIDNRCLSECVGSNTCTLNASGACITCSQGPKQSSCQATGCVQTLDTATVEQSTCTTWPDSHQPFVGAQITLLRSPDCSYTAHQRAGVLQLGTFLQLESGDYLAQFPTFGGTCTGTPLELGALGTRVVFSCPGCQFNLHWSR